MRKVPETVRGLWHDTFVHATAELEQTTPVTVRDILQLSPSFSSTRSSGARALSRVRMPEVEGGVNHQGRRRRRWKRKAAEIFSVLSDVLGLDIQDTLLDPRYPGIVNRRFTSATEGPILSHIMSRYVYRIATFDL